MVSHNPQSLLTLRRVSHVQGFSLIDTGLYEHADLLDAALDSMLDGNSDLLTEVVITHSHRDHVGNLQHIIDRYTSATVYVHDMEVPLLDGSQRYRSLDRDPGCTLFACLQGEPVILTVHTYLQFILTIRTCCLRLPLAACRLPLAACRLPLAACHLPLAACRLPLAACHSPLAACRLQPFACQLLTLLAASLLSQAPPRAPAAPPTRRRCRRRTTRAWRR